VTVEETIVEVSKKHSGTGERMIIKPYPKDDEPRTFGVRPGWLEEVAEHIRVDEIGRDELLFSGSAGNSDLAYTFRTRVWLPAVKASGIDFGVRVHDLRHAHALWLLAGGADLTGRSLATSRLESRCYQTCCRAKGLALRVMSRRPCTVWLSMDTSPAEH